MKHITASASAMLCFGLVISMTIGCSYERRIDGSTQETVQDSLFQMYRGLSSEDRDELERAVEIVASDGETLESISFDHAFSMPRPRANVDGMTAAEILARAEEFEAEFLGREARKQARNNLIDEQRARTNEFVDEFSDLAKEATEVKSSKAIEIAINSESIAEEFDKTIKELNDQFAVKTISDNEYVAGIDAATERMKTEVITPMQDAIAETIAKFEASRQRALERRNRIAYANEKSEISQNARRAVLDRYNQTPTKNTPNVDVEWELMDLETKYLADFEKTKKAFVKNIVSRSDFNSQINSLTETFKAKSFGILEASRNESKEKSERVQYTKFREKDKQGTLNRIADRQLKMKANSGITLNDRQVSALNDAFSDLLEEFRNAVGSFVTLEISKDEFNRLTANIVENYENRATYVLDQASSSR